MDEESPKQGAPAWVVTFGDMMSLLLCFFVLLLSFSNMEVERFKVLAGYIREAFGVQRQKHFTEIPSGQLKVTAGAATESNYERVTLFEQIKVVVDSLDMESEVRPELTEEGVRIQIDGGALFDSADATVKETMIPFLRKIAQMAKEREGRVVVEGHSDDRPIRTARFPSNWELSSARAGAVVRWLAEEGGIPAHRMEAVGYAETKPVESNDTPEGRAQNRRVEILIEEERSS